ALIPSSFNLFDIHDFNIHASIFHMKDSISAFYFVATKAVKCLFVKCYSFTASLHIIFKFKLITFENRMSLDLFKTSVSFGKCDVPGILNRTIKLVSVHDKITLLL